MGHCFNDIVIERTDDANTGVQYINVPLSYAPKEKMLARVKQDPALDKTSAIELPRMSFMYNSYSYDGGRKLNMLGRNVKKDDTNASKFKYQYNPVPYNLSFSLYIYVKNAEDGTKIVEQILPYFTPEWTATVNLIPELDTSLDIPIELSSVTSEDVFDGSFTNRRAIVWTLQFTVRGWFFGPIKKSPIVKVSNTNFYFGSNTANTSEIVSSIQVTPGMYANGVATSNSAASISPLLIQVDDDWDYAIRSSGLVIVEE